MWMAYRNYTEITDLKTGVQNLSEKFQDLAMDADHGALCGHQKYISQEECLSRASRYWKGNELCEQFLKLEINFRQLSEGLRQINLDGFLNILHPYLKVSDIMSEDEDDDDHEANESGYDTVN